MRIIDFAVREQSAPEPKVLPFDSTANVFYSVKNSTGKTTLVRVILYTLGFSIPDTELVNFEEYTFTLKLEIKNEVFIIKRHGHLCFVNEEEYDLPADEDKVHANIFGTANIELLHNILGAFYFDQEKGWTLLNRGVVIGSNRFTVEGLLRGLNNDDDEDSYKLVAQLDAIEEKIKKYKVMYSVAEYQVAVNQSVNHKTDYETIDEVQDFELITKRQRLQEVERELNIIDDIIKTNTTFVQYLEKHKIFVENPIDHSSILVTKDTLLGYSQLSEINYARRQMLALERSSLKSQIAKIDEYQRKQLALFSMPTIEEEFTHRMAEIQSISPVQTLSMIDKLKKQRTALHNKLVEKTKTNNAWVDKAYEIINKYSQELEIPFKKMDLFTRKLKSKSGAILHKMVFIYKLAYISLLSERLGYPIPIICDSPSGREVEKETINSMLKILKRDFSNHQIIMASIYKYTDIFPNANIILMDGKLFDRPTIFDFN